MKRSLLASLLVSALLAVPSGAALSQTAPKLLRIGTGTAPTHIQNQGARALKEFLETKSNGAIKVEIYPSAQLGDGKTMLNSIKIGALEASMPSPADVGNVARDFNILNFPFLFSSQKVANEIFDGPWGQELLGKLEQNGYKGLAIVDSGFRHTTNSRRPIKTIEDFKGLKIRMQPNPLHLDVFRALGANPVPLNFSELFTALQQGVVDGQENPLNNIFASRFNEVQKYITLDGHVYDTNIFVIGLPFYNSLTPEQRQLLDEGTRLVVSVMRAGLKKGDDDALAALQKGGMEVTEVTPEFRAQMVEATRPVIERYAKNVDQTLYNSLLDRIKNAQ